MRDNGINAWESSAPQGHRSRHGWKRFTLILSLVVLVGTVGALVLPAQTMNRPQCGLQEHTHINACYADAGGMHLACPLQSAHGEDADFVSADCIVHTHDEKCYTPGGALVCTLPERETGTVTHQHSDACFAADGPVLICRQPAHAHTDACLPLTVQARGAAEKVSVQIAQLPALSEVEALLDGYDRGGDADGRQAYLEKLGRSVAEVREAWDALSAAQRAAVTDAEQLMALCYLTDPPILTEQEQVRLEQLSDSLNALPSPQTLQTLLNACDQARDLTGWERFFRMADTAVQRTRALYDALPLPVHPAVSVGNLTALEVLLTSLTAPQLQPQEQEAVTALAQRLEALPDPAELRTALQTLDAQNRRERLYALSAQLEPLRSALDGLTDLQQRALDDERLTLLETLAQEENARLTDAEQEQVDTVDFLIAALEPLSQAKQTLAALEGTGDASALAAYTDKLTRAVTAARKEYDSLSYRQQLAVQDSQKLLDYLAWLAGCGLLENDRHPVQLYADAGFTRPVELPYTVLVRGALPLGARVCAFPTTFEMGDAPVLCALDITIFLADGSVYQPEQPMEVCITGLPITGQEELDAFHLTPGDCPTRVDYRRSGDTVSISAEHFSVYALIDAYDLNRIAEPGDPETIQALIDSGWFTYWSDAAAAIVQDPVSSVRQALQRPLRASADSGAPYALDSSSQITNFGGSNTDGSVTVSKTIAGTAVENVFDITLKVDTTTNITQLMEEPDMAVVIVMDISNTMNDKFGGGTRYSEAVLAAEAFMDKFAENNKGYSKLGYVAFNAHAHEIFGLSKCTTAEVTGLKNTLRTETGKIINNYSEDSGDRFTNIEAGLKRASDMLNGASNKNKYIIFLSDGFPTTYISSGYNGYNPYTGSGTPGADGVFYDFVEPGYCPYGTSYSDKAAIRARDMAAGIKNSGTKIFSIGIDIGGQTIQGFDTHRGHGWSVIDRTSESYELGSATDTNAFKNWLKDKIGSGYYYDSTNTEGLKAAFDAIFEELKGAMEQSNSLKWIAADPMPIGTQNNEVTMEFIGFYDKQGNLIVKPPVCLGGTSAENGENTAQFNSEKNAIAWDLKNSGYTVTASGNSTTYHYELVYRVRLKNELTSFKELQVYNTNGKTTLTYQEVMVVDGKETISDDKTIDFPIPAVKGYLGELEFKKVDEAKKPLSGAVFTLTHDDIRCPICRGDEETHVPVGPFEVTSDKDGKVGFQNIPSGHVYTLKETNAPSGYQLSGAVYTVTVAYDKVTVDGVWNGEFVNTATPQLPSTGGAGTLLYTFSGAALMLTAALMYSQRRKKKEAVQH